MRKTPDAIKTALLNCTKLRHARYCEEQCPYYADGLACLRNLHADAAACIGRLGMERDTLLADLKGAVTCEFCKHNGEYEDWCDCDCGCCEHIDHCACFACTSKNNHWEWRGIKEENEC